MSGDDAASAKPSRPSLSEILAASLLAEDHAAPASPPQPTPGEILEEALTAGGYDSRPHPAVALLSEYRVADDRSLQLVAMAQRFCAEIEARNTGLTAEDAWDVLQDMPPELEENLLTIAGWAALSAYVTGGAFVLRLPISNGEQ